MPRQSAKKRKVQPEPKAQHPSEVEAKVVPDPNWSPWDATERTVLEIHKLDLAKSYHSDTRLRSNMAKAAVGRPTLKPRPERQRWQHKGKKPIEDIEDLPKGWHATEPDLDEADLDGQIDRCHERIEDNIMPKFFKEKLRGLEISKAYYDRLSQNEPQDLSPEVYERIHTLRAIQKQIRNVDKSEQLPNVLAILKAYIEGRLRWTSGLVTYWSKGVKLCEPRPFNWDEFEVINAAHGRDKSFWTEGLSGPGPQLQGATLIIGSSPRALAINLYRIAVRAPGHEWWDELEFVHDTGASIMHIYQHDIRRILGPHIRQAGSYLPVVSTNQFRAATGTMTRDIVELEVTLLNHERKRILPWTRVQCVVSSETYVEGVTRRLDGPFVRAMMYTSTRPDGNFHLTLSTVKKSNLFSDLTHTIPLEERAVPMANFLPPTEEKGIFAIQPPSQPENAYGTRAMPDPHISWFGS